MLKFISFGSGSSGNSYLLYTDKDGILIEDDDEKKYAKAIKELLEDREKLESLKKSTYELSTRFEIDNIVEKWVNFIESI